MQRRTFLRAATGLAALKADSINRARAAANSIDGRPPEQAARDEDFWREIQQAFTVDRNIVNLNNGGVCPSPKVVQDAMRRQLEFSNMAPAYTMWTVLEPEIENVRARRRQLWLRCRRNGHHPQRFRSPRNCAARNRSQGGRRSVDHRSGLSAHD